MNLINLLDIFSTHPNVVETVDWRKKSRAKKSQTKYVDGLYASARSLYLASVDNLSPTSFVWVLEDAELAAYAYNDLKNISEKDNVFFFPHSYKKTIKHGVVEPSNLILRTEVLNQWSKQTNSIVVTYPDALIEKVAPIANFKNASLDIEVGQTIGQSFVLELLENFGFEYVDFVYEPGQYAVRGSIIDIFSFAYSQPYRIDFFGDEVETIRVFDIEKQLSIESKNKITIASSTQADDKNYINFLPVISYWNNDTVLVVDKGINLSARANQLYDDLIVDENHNSKSKKMVLSILNGEEVEEAFNPFNKICFGKGKDSLLFQTASQPLFHKNFDLVSENMSRYLEEGYKCFICSDSKKQTDRIASIFTERGDIIHFEPVLHTLHEGFIDHDLKFLCYTDHQIFDRFHRFKLGSDKAKAGKVAMTLKELNQFQIGDYVVHIDHGVGKFGGLVNSNMNGKPQEMIKLIFRNEDVVFVSIHNLHRISKYKGKDGVPPVLNKLGSGAWEKLKERTKKKVKDIARDLIKLYSLRMQKEGFAFSEDSYLQHQLEASFMYEDTPDQEKATKSIKEDMEKAVPMDRLVCGDVGFGKTEVAMRAAFKAVADSKQVAVLVPTTVLALQHFKSFSSRLKEFPCNIAYLSRAKSAKQTKEILLELEQGKIDILIGTHKIVGANVKFKDLGLLIIDEEQKFGVSAKEKLKQMRINVDTLTLTATPIPRTLQFSLLGARDLSIINTPPPNRYPVYTEVIQWSDDVIKEAINNEINRNGQIFFIHNRVQTIYTMKQKIQKLVPEARIAIAHGQMPPEELEKIILDFVEYDYDILLATTVIESGIDIPNTNTIIINSAQSFGLSDLHQLRGRVGRSNRKAYCYLIAPPMKDLNVDAKRRLNALETFSDLGSGFNIAMQDLDIRGAGNMLGAEQSGFITDLGYETYQKILMEAMSELFEEEEFAAEAEKHNSKQKHYVTDCFVESDLELGFPHSYIESVSERMTLYRELDSITSQRDLEEYKIRLVDRFGKIPVESESLINILPLRWRAMELGIEKLILKNNKLIVHLVGNLNSPYYNTPEFGSLLNYAVANHRRCQLKEQNGKRTISFADVPSVEVAIELLNSL